MLVPAPPAAAARPVAPAASTVAAAGHTASLAATAPAGTAPALGPAVQGVPGLPDGAREVPARRTRTSRSYATPRGTLTTRSSVGSTNFPDAAGAWQVIDNTLVPDSTPGAAATNRANRYQLHLPPSLAAGPIKVTLGGLAVAFSLEGAGSSPAALAGSVARYANALPGVSVAYAAASDSVEEALTLSSAAAPHAFVYTLATSGLTARPNAHGGIDFVDGSGTVQFVFVAPVMEDAAQARSSALALSLGSDATGSTVTLSDAAAWLANPARQYPVVVDPALVTSTGDSQDCPIDSANPTTSYCGISYLAAGANGSEVARSLVQFPLALRGEVLGASVGLYQFAAGNTLSFTYNADSGTHTITDSQGRVLTFSYTNASYPSDVTQLADWTGRSWQYGYDTSGNLVTSTDPAGKLTRSASTTGDLLDAGGHAQPLLRQPADRGDDILELHRRHASLVRHHRHRRPGQSGDDPLHRGRQPGHRHRPVA